MTQHFHSVVWIDHREAHVFLFNWDKAEGCVVRHRDAPRKVHHKAGSIGAGHEEEDAGFFDAVADAVASTGEILIVGPSLVPLELLKHLEAKRPDIAKKVVGIGALDHPSDGELLKYARTYFRRADRMMPQRPGASPA